MKKIFAFYAIGLLTISLSAQTEQGNLYIALGNAYSPVNNLNYPLFKNNGMSFGNEWITGITQDGDDEDDFGNDYWDKNEKDKNTNFNLAGQFGYFFTDGLLTGLGIEYGYFSNRTYQEYDIDGDGFDDEYTSKDKFTSIAFSPFVKYYFPIQQNYIFLSSSYTFGTLKISSEWERDYANGTNDDDDDEAEPYKTSRLQFGTGIAFFFTKSVSLEPSVNYAFNSYRQDREVYLGPNPFTGESMYDDQERKTSTNAFYFKVAASIYF